tara:strand:- start:808 stop:1566 length:759 start_codon:yes stop_codon:yes gene_type:complete
MSLSFIKQLNERPIAYYPIYRKVTGSTTAGVLLSQLMYWFSKKNKIYKVDSEIMEETLLTENELRSAKKKIKSLDFINVTKEGIPCKTFYTIDWDIYQTSLVKFTNSSIVDFTKLPELNSQNSDSENNATITETTAKITSEITTKKKNNAVASCPLLNILEVKSAWDEWMKVRASKKASNSQQAISRAVNSLVKFSDNKKDVAIQILNNSSDGGWTKLYELKPKYSQQSIFKNKPQLGVNKLTQEERDEMPF